MARPCADPDVAKVLPCAGGDGICYGVPCWERRSFAQGERKYMKHVTECTWVESCRDWWRRNKGRLGDAGCAGREGRARHGG
jgi:hypothetical protein